ncbi:calcium-binding protein [Streptomyces populi]|uniref:Calcium-binding protein n=1 Tax=Streptomyces populi TaxID=2058924 RepID=A0A2I0SYL4_9ACTN|nr:calcium-binding protein [Streptomyces populi]PKT75046.1 calcium-binding protein [Streptomyces populi]
MRTRTVGGVLSGALAVAALTAPAAGAVDSTGVKDIVVNGGKPVVIGVSGTVSVPVTMKVTGSHRTYRADAQLYHGGWTDSDAWVNSNKACGEHAGGGYTCKLTFAFTARKTVKKNSQAGPWSVYAHASGNADAEKVLDNAFRVVRAAKLTANASPEPVKKGKAITVTGALTRANWETGKYAGFTNQAVKLQFRKKGSSTYTTVKTVKSSSTGALKTSATASADGYWRWSFAGTSTTSTATAAGDYVDVQ